MAEMPLDVPNSTTLFASIVSASTRRRRPSASGTFIRLPCSAVICFSACRMLRSTSSAGNVSLRNPLVCSPGNGPGPPGPRPPGPPPLGPSGRPGPPNSGRSSSRLSFPSPFLSSFFSASVEAEISSPDSSPSPFVSSVVITGTRGGSNGRPRPPASLPGGCARTPRVTADNVATSDSANHILYGFTEILLLSKTRGTGVRDQCNRPDAGIPPAITGWPLDLLRNAPKEARKAADRRNARQKTGGQENGRSDRTPLCSSFCLLSCLPIFLPVPFRLATPSSTAREI